MSIPVQTPPAPITTEAKRAELRNKIEAAEQRNEAKSAADYARDATETATVFVKENPLAAVAGVAVIALIIGAMLPSGRRAARSVGNRTVSLATLAAELGAVYGANARDSVNDAARTGSDRLEDFGEVVGLRARGLKRDADYYADSTSDTVRTASRRKGRKTSRVIRDLRSRIGR